MRGKMKLLLVLLLVFVVAAFVKTNVLDVMSDRVNVSEGKYLRGSESALLQAPKEGKTPLVRPPLVVLKTTKEFAIGGVGYSGMISDGERALRSVLTQPHAREQLLPLLESAEIEGQLYALLGLKLLNDPIFEREIRKYSSMDLPVNTMEGCIFRRVPAREVAAEISNGSYR